MSTVADPTTQNAPARSCSSDEGKDRTNNLQEEGTAMTSMTETPASTKDATCPAWCREHPPLEPRTHVGVIDVHGVEISLCQDGDGAPTLHFDELSYLTPDRASEFGAALRSAADVAKGRRQVTGADCADWCTDHKTAVDPADPTEIAEICRTSVTCGEVTVDVEDSHSWIDDPNHGGPIVPPDIYEMGPADAKDYAAALIAAARLIEEAK